MLFEDKLPKEKRMKLKQAVVIIPKVTSYYVASFLLAWSE